MVTTYIPLGTQVPTVLVTILRVLPAANLASCKFHRRQTALNLVVKLAAQYSHLQLIHALLHTPPLHLNLL